jgi:hypothetical protein
MQALRLQLNVSLNLNEAITIAMNTVGQNYSAVSASIQPETEFLVYRVFVADGCKISHGKPLRKILIAALIALVQWRRGMTSITLPNRTRSLR